MTPNRREILRRVLALPGVQLTGGAPAAAKSRWKMRLSTSSVHFSSLPIEQACERIAALGFEAIDFWNSRFQCPHMDEIENRLGAGGLKEVLAKNKLKLYAFTCYHVGYPKYAKLLGQAGGGVAVRESKYGKVETLASEMKAFLEGLKPELELAEENNSYLAIENHGNALLNTLDSFKAFVEFAAHPRLGIALAPYHLQASGISVEEVTAIVGKRLLFYYAWQRAKDLEQLPGIGPTDFTPWLAALAKAGYSHYVNPFMHGQPPVDVMSQSLEKSVRYLKDCYRKI
jgi:sugar phosphate isomerase/epimerase